MRVDEVRWGVTVDAEHKAIVKMIPPMMQDLTVELMIG